MAASDIATGFMWLIIIVSLLSVFIIAVALMARYRKKLLQEMTKEIPTDGLDLSKKVLGKVYESASETWDRRHEHRPVPELQHLTQGWIKGQDGHPFFVRDAICNSISKIQSMASSINPQYSRKPYQSVQQYLKYLREIDGSQIKKRTCDVYLQYYHSARYGNPNLVFDGSTYALFQTALSALSSEIQSLPD